MRRYHHFWDSILNRFMIKLSFDHNKYDISSPLDIYKSVESNKNPEQKDQIGLIKGIVQYIKKLHTKSSKSKNKLHKILHNLKNFMKAFISKQRLFSFDLNSLHDKRLRGLIENTDISDADLNKTKMQHNWHAASADNNFKKRSINKFILKRFIIEQHHQNIQNQHTRLTEKDKSDNKELNINL